VIKSLHVEDAAPSHDKPRAVAMCKML